MQPKQFQPPTWLWTLDYLKRWQSDHTLRYPHRFNGLAAKSGKRSPDWRVYGTQTLTFQSRVWHSVPQLSLFPRLWLGKPVSLGKWVSLSERFWMNYSFVNDYQDDMIIFLVNYYLWASVWPSGVDDISGWLVCVCLVWMTSLGDW